VTLKLANEVHPPEKPGGQLGFLCQMMSALPGATTRNDALAAPAEDVGCCFSCSTLGAVVLMPANVPGSFDRVTSMVSPTRTWKVPPLLESVMSSAAGNDVEATESALVTDAGQVAASQRKTRCG
jgi:hypothetical protein